MLLEDLHYSYPDHLVATEPREPCRIALNFRGEMVKEITHSQLHELFAPGDVLVVNDTKVENRRVFANSIEILFVQRLSDLEWEVLFPSRSLKLQDQLALPGDVTLTLVSKGLPQRVRLSAAIGAKYFAQFGEPALPPYIQKARAERHARAEDQAWYQTDWAEELGSCAAPTASLHFKNSDLETLALRGVQVKTLTLHVGLGTFLPIKTQDLRDHEMHEEWVEIPFSTLIAIELAHSQGKKVWALGTTVTRALESWKAGLLTENNDGHHAGATKLFIQPGFQFQTVDALLTNFHQPGSTLLALVAAFYGLDLVKRGYAWAIENQFRLFSYGDLSAWIK